MKHSLEHNLPDSPFASPTKAGDYMAAFSNGGPNEAIDSDASATSEFGPTSAFLPPPSALDVASFKSFNCQLPRYHFANFRPRSN